MWASRASTRLPRHRPRGGLCTVRTLLGYPPLGVGLQGVERGHQLVAVRKRRAGFIGSLPDEDLHSCECAPRRGRRRAPQVIDSVAGDARDGVHTQNRGMEAFKSIGRVEVVVLSVVRYCVLGAAMFW